MADHEKVYRGFRQKTYPFCRVTVGGEPLPSSTGSDFEWGYGGCGPRALALALAEDLLGEKIDTGKPCAHLTEPLLTVIKTLPRTDNVGDGEALEWQRTETELRACLLSAV